MSNTEMEWIGQARNGDGEAFSRLVETYQRPVYNLCYRMLGNEQEAEDAAQESFMRAYLSLKKYDTSRPFPTWLLSITAHYCIDQIRKHRMPEVPLDALPDETIPDDIPSPENRSVKRETENRIRTLLQSLDAQDRAAVIMRYWYDFSEEEIASTLSLSVSAVKSRLFRSRKEIARLWLEQPAETIHSARRQHESSAV